MPVIIPPGFSQLVTHFVFDGEPRRMLTTHAVAHASPPSVGVANGVLAAYNTYWKAEMRLTTTIEKVSFRIGQDGGDPVVVESTDAAVVGSGSGAGLPSNCAILIRKQTASGGRRNKGRLFMPGVAAEANVDQNGIASAAAVLNWQNAQDDWNDAVLLLTDIENFVILHSEAPSTPTTVIGHQVQSRIATQRRRMRR